MTYRQFGVMVPKSSILGVSCRGGDAELTEQMASRAKESIFFEVLEFLHGESHVNGSRYCEVWEFLHGESHVNGHEVSI